MASTPGTDINLMAPPTEEDLMAPPPAATPASTDLMAPPGEDELLMAPPDAREPDDIEKEIKDRTWYDKPLLAADTTSEDEITAIAKKFGVDREKLRSLAPYYGAHMEGGDYFSADEVKRGIGGIGQVFMGIPQKLGKLVEGGAMERALDELQDLGAGRRSFLQAGAELAPVGAAATTAVSVGKAALHGGAIGAIAGLAGSHQGEEGTGALVGGALGAGIGAAAQKVVGAITSRMGATETRALEKAGVVPENMQSIEEGTRRTLAERATSEKDIDAIIHGGMDLDDEAATRIVREQMGEAALKDITDQSSDAHAIYTKSLGDYTQARADLESKLAEVGESLEMAGATLNQTPETPRDVTALLEKLGPRMERERLAFARLEEQEKVTERALSSRRTPETREPLERRLAEIRGKQSQRAGALQGLVDDVGTLQERLATAKVEARTQELFRGIDKDLQQQKSKILRGLDELREPVEVEGEAALRRRLAQQVVDDRIVGFGKYLLKGEAPRTVEETEEALAAFFRNQGGPAARAEAYEQYSRRLAGLSYIEKAGGDVIGARAGQGDHFGNTLLNGVSDAQFVMRAIDHVADVGIEPVHRELNKQITRMSFVRTAFRGAVDRVYRATDKAVDAELKDGTKVYLALDKGDLSGLSATEKQSAEKVAQYFSEGRDFVNGVVKEKDSTITPLSIEAMRNPDTGVVAYVPHMFKDPDQLVTALGKKVDEAGGKAAIEALDKTALDMLGKEEGPIQDLMKGLGILDAKPPQSGRDLLLRIEGILGSTEGRARMETVAKAALERKADIPLFMRETNMYKLMDKWASNTLKHLYLRKSIAEMANKQKLLEEAGYTVEARYVRTLLEDLQGIRKGTAAEFAIRGEMAWQKGIDKLLGAKPTPLARAAAGILKALPDVLGDINKQIYPNLLGASPRAVIMNLTGAFAKTVPELGQTPYAYTLAFRGAALARERGFTHQLGKVKGQGLIPEDFVGGFRKAIAEGIRRADGYAVPTEALNHITQLSMKVYQKVEEMNRVLILSMGESMASDLAAGSKGAAAALARLPRTVQRQVLDAAGNQEAVAQAITSHLNASTAYNYNRASMAQFARAAGPMFSTFSKWPLATAGEIISEYRMKGTLKGSQRLLGKFMAPVALFAGVDKLLTMANGKGGDASDRQNKLLGKAGLAGSAPIGSVASIAKGDFFTPPMVDAMLGTVLPILNGEEHGGGADKASRALAGAVGTFAPGAGWVRFLTDDLVTIVSGKKVEGGDFIEKTREGIRRITKISK